MYNMMNTTHKPLTATDCMAIAQIANAASRGDRVRRLIDNTIVEGTMRHIVKSPDDYGFAGSDMDVRDAYVRVTTTNGFDVAWAVADLICPVLDGYCMFE